MRTGMSLSASIVNHGSAGVDLNFGGCCGLRVGEPGTRPDDPVSTDPGGVGPAGSFGISGRVGYFLVAPPMSPMT